MGGIDEIRSEEEKREVGKWEDKRNRALTIDWDQRVQEEEERRRGSTVS